MKKNSLWLMMIALVACTNEPTDDGGDTGGGNPPTDLTFIQAANGTHSVAGLDYVVDATTGNISIDGVETYIYVSVDFSESMATYSPKDKPAEFLGARILINSDDTKNFTVYLLDRVDFWTDKTAIQWIDVNELGRSAKDDFVKNNNKVTVTTDNVDPKTEVYDVDKIHGHLLTTGTTDVVYHYMGYKSATEAYFRNADEKFFGIAQITVDSEYKTYRNNRTDLWDTKDEVIFSVDHVVGERDAFIKNNTTVIVTTLPSVQTTYDVDPINGNLLTTGSTTVVYTYMGYNSDTKAYFKKANANEFFGIEQITANTTFKTYIKNRTEYWTTKDAVKFAIEHEVGGAALTLGVIWKNVSDLPGDKNGFAALSFGDNIWLVGGNDNVYKSDNQGDSWTTTTAVGLADLTYTTGVALANNHLLVATSKNVYKSVDDGAAWESVYTILTESSEGFRVLHVTDSDDTRAVPNGIYFIGANTVIFSTDGVNWAETAMTGAYGDKDVFGMGIVAIKSVFYIFGVYPTAENWTSADGGKTWTVFASNFPGGRDRIAMVSAPDFVYHIGWTGANDVWKAPVTDLSTWTQVVEDGGYTKRDTARALYFPAKTGTHDERLLLMGGRNGGTSVWRAEVE